MPATDPTTTAMTPSMSAMLAALSADRGASVTELSGRAGLGRSTAARVLTTLEGMGLARRERPDRSADHSSPDLWFTTATEQTAPPAADGASPDPETDAEPDTQPSDTPAETDAADPQHAHNLEREEAVESVKTPTRDGADEPTAPHGGAEPDGALDDEAAITQPDPDDHPDPELADAPEPAVPGAATRPAPEQKPEARSAADGGHDADAAPSATGATERLGKGELRALVYEHLKAHPDEDFTASQVGKALNKSSGAVSNNFDTLTKTGDAQMTCEKPRRFRFLAKAAN